VRLRKCIQGLAEDVCGLTGRVRSLWGVVVPHRLSNEAMDTLERE
jgi:hypothetical protein